MGLRFEMHTPPKRVLPKVPLLKTYGLLALATAATVLPFRPEFLAWLGIFLTAAGIAAFVTAARYVWIDPPRPATYPGLVAGTVTILVYAIGPRLFTMGG